MTKNLKIANVATVLGEAALYDRFNIQATVSHVSDIDNHERDRNMMAVRTAVVQDKTGFATMTVFSQLTKDTADRKSYRFTNVNEDRYKKERVLKTTEMTKIISIEDLDVHIYEHDVTPNTVSFDGKLTSVQLDGLTIVYQ